MQKGTRLPGSMSARLRAYYERNPDANAYAAAKLFKCAESLSYTVRKEVRAKKAAEAARAASVEVAAQGVAAQGVLDLTPDMEITTTAAPAVSVDDTLNTRAAAYGKFVDVAETSQAILALIGERIAERGVPVQHDMAAALQMISMKLARIANGDPNHLDSWLDIAGYATLVADRLVGKAPR